MYLATRYKTLLNRFEVNTPLRLSHLFAQLEYESNLKPISENLNYSAQRLMEVFNTKEIKRFPTLEIAKQYERKPEKIANRVYANRMNNGDEASGDGWKFRGRGFIQITGKDNYTQLSKDTGINYVTDPDSLLTEANSMVSALWFWDKNKLNVLADEDNIRAITRRINGGYNGIVAREKLLKKYKEIFNV